MRTATRERPASTSTKAGRRLNTERRVWVDRVYPDLGYYDDLTHNINVLYEDTHVAENPRGQIGVSLANEEEAVALEALKAVLVRFWRRCRPGSMTPR